MWRLWSPWQWRECDLSSFGPELCEWNLSFWCLKAEITWGNWHEGFYLILSYAFYFYAYWIFCTFLCELALCQISCIVCALIVHVFAPLQMTSYEMFREYGMVAVSGPTWDQVPPFQWSTSPYKDLMHMGHPDTWAFKPIQVSWTS